MEKTEIAGPGFINFYLKSDVIYDALANLLKAGSEYGNLPKQETPRIQVEYVSANPTGPLHVIVKDGCVIIEPTQKGLENQGFVAGSICF